MAFKKKHEEGHENQERWLLTYADLITLLCAFFVILFAMASVDASKFKVLAQSMSMAFGSAKGGGENIITNFQGAGVSPVSANPDLVRLRENKEFEKIVKLIKNYADQNNLTKSVKTSITERGLVINLSDNVLFESGRAELSPRAMEVLDRLAEMFFKAGRYIRVEGHTDDVPIRTYKYESNWQLSTDRATNVIMYWLSKHPEMAPRFSAAGYGEHHPRATNATPEGRALNRRVEIVLLRESVAKREM